MSFLRQFDRVNRKVLTPLLIAVVISGIIAYLQWTGFDPLYHYETYEKNFNVQFGKKAPVDPRLVFLAIDENSYADEIGADEVGSSRILGELRGTWPWSREVWAEVIERLMQAHARVVILDLLFAAPNDGDDKLRAVLEKYKDRVVFGSNIITGEDAHLMMPRLGGVTPSPDNPNPSATDLDKLTEFPIVDTRVGFVSQWPDDDEVVRRTYFYRRMDDLVPGATPPKNNPRETPGIVCSLACRAIQDLGLEDKIPDSWEPQLFRYAGRPGLTFPTYSLYKIFIPKFWENNFHNGADFRDKVVLVGPLGGWSHDVLNSPFVEPLPGPEMHLNVLSAVLQGAYLHELNYQKPLSILMILLVGGFAFLVSQTIKSPYLQLIIAFGTALLMWAFSLYYCYDHLNLYFSVSSAVVGLLITTTFLFVYQIVDEQYNKFRLRGVLDRYMSKDLVKDVLDNPNSYFNTIGGARKPVAILFSDVRSFTTISEGADAGDLVKKLNEYLSEMVKVVFQNQGTLDKFIGDAVMALWGSVISGGPRVDACRAVRAALDMQAELVKLNEGWKARNMDPFRFGIGINHGEVIVGNVGSEQKMEITVIGDAVNLASRLEGLTKEYHLELLIGENVAELVREDFELQFADNVRVKGKYKPVKVYTVLAEKKVGVDSGWTDFLIVYQDAMEAYLGRNFEEAKKLFMQAEALGHPNDLAQIYIERCEAYIANPPGSEWDGVYTMTKK